MANELTSVQVSVIEQVIAGLKESQTRLQRLITDAEYEKAHIEVLQAQLTRLLPTENRFNHLFG